MISSLAVVTLLKIPVNSVNSCTQTLLDKMKLFVVTGIQLGLLDEAGLLRVYA